MSLAAKDLRSLNIITAIPSDKILMLWDEVSPLLYPAVERSHGRWTMQTLLAALKEGRQQLWIVFEGEEPIKGVGTTEILDYPNRKMLAVQYLGGKGLDTWGLSFLDIIEDFAKAAGCSGIEATARKGFWKWFQERDYQDAYTVFEKEISK
jgi:hypothetical protein|tara:strand:+ start:235 stop:687 length:453 start_codon:yes stop_codon:yes gene_type:complete